MKAEKAWLADLEAATGAAKEAGVSFEPVQAELLEDKADSPKIESPTSPIPSPSHGGLIDTSRPTPIGIQICQACEKIYGFLQEPERSNGDDLLEDLCRTAKLEGASPDLKNSIFGLMRPEDIKSFLQAPDHQFWQQIKQNTEEFIKLLEDPGAAVPYSVDEMTPEAKNAKVRSIRPVVMDQSVREPATNTPFGHTGYQKFLTLQIVKGMGFKDIAISGQYYGASYTPETQVLEWMKVKGEPMDGMIVMFAPGRGDREAGIKAIKDFGIPNAFLDLTMKASVRFKQSDFISSVLETVEILDEIFTRMGFEPNPWRSEEKINCDPGRGEISVNLVDLMEFLDLKPDGTMDDKKKSEAEDAFSTWKKSNAFRRRVVGILTEEGRGVANYKDYGTLSRWLRGHFPRDEEYRILVHAHAGDGNTQDAASVEAALEGANGVWAAVIPQAAQSGHNSSMVFLDNMVQMGNGHVLADFWLHQGAQCARHIYYLNFNSYTIPDDCPIWGARVDQLLHTAFSTVSGKSSDWSNDKSHRFATQSGDVPAGVVGPKGRAGDHVKEVRDLGFALMNADIRANMNEQATLKQLWDIAARNKTEKIRCDQVAGYLKAQQHQGEKE
ncbi:PRY3 [Symbiodinium necroappetens]|uniref:PRY3 protein n=1 Tax=Symbiodinium necroappetens TaxID=1628268 RepID=A0A812ZV16_9DINO|nr:PRY3 [Symbiodinium necroappetens]